MSREYFFLLDAVWKLIERVVSSLRTTIELFHFTFRRCTFMNRSNCQTLLPVYFLSSYPFALTFHRPFWNLHRAAVTFTLRYRFTFYATFSPRIIYALSRNMETSRSLRSLIFTVLRAFTRVLESSRNVRRLVFTYLWI